MRITQRQLRASFLLPRLVRSSQIESSQLNHSMVLLVLTPKFQSPSFVGQRSTTKKEDSPIPSTKEWSHHRAVKRVELDTSQTALKKSSRLSQRTMLHLQSYHSTVLLMMSSRFKWWPELLIQTSRLASNSYSLVSVQAMREKTTALL